MPGRILILLLVIAFWGCTTTGIPVSNAESATMNLVNSINSDNIRKVTGKVMYPFLLDTEIILAEQDIKTFWQDYTKNGFSLDNPEIVSIKKVGLTKYKEFGESMDIKLFFKKYLPQSCYLVKIRAQNRLFTFIIKPGKEALPAFYGYKGASL